MPSGCALSSIVFLIDYNWTGRGPVCRGLLDTLKLQIYLGLIVGIWASLELDPSTF